MGQQFIGPIYCTSCIPSSQLVASLFSEPVGISLRSSHIQPRQNMHSFQRSPEIVIWMLSSSLMFWDNQPTDSTPAIVFLFCFLASFLPNHSSALSHSVSGPVSLGFRESGKVCRWVATESSLTHSCVGLGLDSSGERLW